MLFGSENDIGWRGIYFWSRQKLLAVNLIAQILIWSSDLFTWQKDASTDSGEGAPEHGSVPGHVPKSRLLHHTSADPWWMREHGETEQAGLGNSLNSDAWHPTHSDRLLSLATGSDPSRSWENHDGEHYPVPRALRRWHPAARRIIRRTLARQTSKRTWALRGLADNNVCHSPREGALVSPDTSPDPPTPQCSPHGL